MNKIPSKQDMEDELYLLEHIQRVPHGNSLPQILKRIEARKERVSASQILVAASLLFLLLSADVLAARMSKKTAQQQLNNLLPQTEMLMYDE
ncbi:MAG: hypothetical protein RL160_1658 [Bacteroidota bacterium]|jgi:hypothetical protein